MTRMNSLAVIVGRRRSILWQTRTTPLRNWTRKHTTSTTHGSKLEKIIRDTIKATGPMTMSTYMQLCLSHPTEGYYMNSNNPVFGKEGDFITSPEISQVFGELLAIWHLTRWHAAGKPPKIRIVELGPGRGTLMYDMLHTLSQFKDCARAVEKVSMVETSSAMRKMQEQKLASVGKEMGLDEGFKVEWCDSIGDVPTPEVGLEETFTMVNAHEFFDALPVHLLEKSAEGWHEVVVTPAPDPTAKTIIRSQDISSPSANSNLTPTSPLRLTRSPSPTPASTLLGSSSPRFAHQPIGARIEVSPSSYRIARQVAQLVNTKGSKGGSALVVDYGAERTFGRSLRAFKNHKIVDIFTTPGHCDITANVDFAYMREAMEGAARTLPAISQRAFLLNMGLEPRLANLIRSLKDRERQVAIAQGAKRLIDPTGMGREYAVMGVVGDGKVSGVEQEDEEVWPFVEKVWKDDKIKGMSTS